MKSQRDSSTFFSNFINCSWNRCMEFSQHGYSKFKLFESRIGLWGICILTIELTIPGTDGLKNFAVTTLTLNLAKWGCITLLKICSVRGSRNRSSPRTFSVISKFLESKQKLSFFSLDTPVSRKTARAHQIYIWLTRAVCVSEQRRVRILILLDDAWCGTAMVVL